MRTIWENLTCPYRQKTTVIISSIFRDLLSKDQTKRLQLKERPDSGVQVKDLQSFVVKSVAEIEQVLTVGNQNRSVGATNMNEHSSRSHAIFTINIDCSRKVIFIYEKYYLLVLW